MRSRFGCLIVITALLLVAALRAPAVVTGDPPPAAPPPPGHGGRLGPPQWVTVAQLPRVEAAGPAARPHPFRPRDPAAYARAKQQADAGMLPTRRPLIAPLSSPGSEQSLTTIRLMDRQTQMNLLADSTFPPDTQMAAGPTYLLEMDNRTGSVWTRSGALVKAFSLQTFFGFPSYLLVADPRVLYDVRSSRWFASMTGYPPDASINEYEVRLAVSASSDPTGPWAVYVVAYNRAYVDYDQPMIGVTDDKVILSWNDFGGPSSNAWGFSGQETWVLNKAELLAGQATVDYFRWGPDTNRFRLVPAQALTATTTAWLVYNNADPQTNQNQSQPTVGVVALTGVPPNQVTWTEWDLPIAATTIPPGALQPNTSALVDTDDDRFLSAVWANDILWTGGNDGCVPAGDTTTRSCLRLIQVSTGGGTPMVLQDFDVGWSGGYLYYPAVSLDGAGNAFFAFSASSGSLYPSLETAAQAAGSLPGTVTSPLLLMAGVGIVVCGRWGDYSAAAPDPTNPAAVWVAGEYMASSTDQCDWGTAAGLVTLNSALATFTPTPSPTPTPTPTPTPVPTPTPGPGYKLWLPFVVSR